MNEWIKRAVECFRISKDYLEIPKKETYHNIYQKKNYTCCVYYNFFKLKKYIFVVIDFSLIMTIACFILDKAYPR